MKYLVISTKSQHAQRLEEELALFDIEGVEILNPQDSIYYQSLWDEDEAPSVELGNEAIFKIFGSKEELDRIVENYKELILKWDFEELIEKDWNEIWASQFKGIEVAGLFVRPPWLEARAGLMDVIIEPGMAFGTGSHETTILCIGALLDFLKEGATVYDVGTGSGILAIVAMLQGAGYVKGIEIDEMALENARLNRELNSVDVDFSQGDLLKGLDRKADLIVANILPTILKNMKEDALELLVEGGHLILSGILDKRVDEVLDDYSQGLKLVDNRSMGQWHVLILEKQ